MRPQGGPGLGSGGSGLRRQRRLWQWAAVGAAIPLGQGTGHGGEWNGSSADAGSQGTGGLKSGEGLEGKMNGMKMSPLPLFFIEPLGS